jgi:hypothetical protein
VLAEPAEELEVLEVEDWAEEATSASAVMASRRTFREA